MPDIFDSEDIHTRDRRFVDETGEKDTNPPADEVKNQEVLEQTISPKEDTPENHSATPNHPERHVGGNQMHIATAYCEKPRNVKFQTQEENEEILLLLRRSFLTNIPWIFLSMIFAILPFFITVLPLEKTPLAFLPPSYDFVLLAFYYLVIGTYALVNFITWYFNTSLITTKRIFDIDFQDLVYKNIAETKMDLIQDVSETETGVLRTVFNFGDVLIQTAGTLENFNLEAIPHPDRVVEVVESLIGKGRGFGV